MLGRTSAIVLSVALALALPACGQKGPLYLPGYPKGATRPYPAQPPTPAPQRKLPDVPAASDEKK